MTTNHTLAFEETSDLAEFLTVMHAAFDRYKTDPLPSSALAESVESLHQDVAQGWVLYGARINHVLVGTVKTYPHGPNLYLGRLAVAPESQGQGIGKALVRAVEDYAGQRGFDGVECKARTSETGNIAMYLQLGYLEVSREITISTTGQPIPTVTLRKALENRSALENENAGDNVG